LEAGFTILELTFVFERAIMMDDFTILPSDERLPRRVRCWLAVRP
jgi:hypothetical protein